MTHIDDLPTASDFGETFNYDVWTPNTQVTLCNVPWNSDYRDVVEFANQATLDAYIAGLPGPKATITKLTLARANAPIRLSLPFNVCYMYNYLRVDNGTSPISATYVDSAGVTHTITDVPKVLYYFVMGVNYIAPNTTEIMVQLDVWQTFGYDVNFGNCYIEQGHIGVANTNQFQNNGRDYLTVPEGLDIGAEYNINETYSEYFSTDLASTDDGFMSSSPWFVMGIAADVTVDPGTTEAPNLSLSPNTSQSEGLPNGFDVLVFISMTAYNTFLLLFADAPWITQTIQFITMVPPLGKSANFILTPVDVFGGSGAPNPIAYRVDFNGIGGLDGAIHRNIGHDITLASDFRDTAKSFLPSRYQILKKFLTYPYCLFELTTYNAAPIVLKPELVGDPNDIVLTIFEHFVPPSPRWAIMPLHYNATGTSGPHDDGEYLDFATYIANFPQFTVMNNGYLQYLASNSGSLPYQAESANWAQQKSLAGAGNTLANVGQSNDNAQAQSRIAIDANNQRMAVANAGGLMGVGENILAAAATGGTSLVTGGAKSIASAGGDVALRSANNTVANNVVARSTAANINTAASIGENNYQYAQFAAKGDYQNAIAGIQAQVQNAKVTQPTSVGQMNGEAFFMAINGGWKLYGKLKQLNPGMMAVIGEYWLRYGYQVNRFGVMPNSLQCMTKFTYWKLKETYITSSRCPEIYKQTIRGIFEKGVTVWANPSDIGNIDIGTNAPLTGISY